MIIESNKHYLIHDDTTYCCDEFQFRYQCKNCNEFMNCYYCEFDYDEAHCEVK